MSIALRALARPVLLLAVTLGAVVATPSVALAAGPSLTISVNSTVNGSILQVTGTGAAENAYLFDLSDSPAKAELDLATGTITIAGTAASRCSAIAPPQGSSASVTCTLDKLATPNGQVRPISFDLAGGDDVLTVDDGNEILPVLVHGGPGADTIDTTMTSDDDIVFGDDGDDTLVTGDGDDQITGGAGSDTVDSGDGDDVVNLAGDGTWGGFATADPDAPVTCGDGEDVVLRSIGTSDPIATSAGCEVDVDPLDAPMTVSGTSAVGQTVSVAQAVARTAPTARTYTWEHCTAITNQTTGDGSGCVAFATGTSATIAAAEVGTIIRVTAATSWTGGHGAITVTAPPIRAWSSSAVPPVPSGDGTYATVPAGQTTVTWNSNPSKSTPLPQLPSDLGQALADSDYRYPMGSMLRGGKDKGTTFVVKHGALTFSCTGYSRRAGGTMKLVLTAGKKHTVIGQATATYAGPAKLVVKLSKPFVKSLKRGKVTKIFASATATWPDGHTVAANQPIKIRP